MSIKKYSKIWLITTFLSLQASLATKGASLIFLFGKFIRFGFFIFSLYLVLGKTRQIAGYDISQMIIFFLVFNLIDTLAQLFFRGIYWFRLRVVEGTFDLNLIKPANVLFQILTYRTDLLDLPLIIIIVIALIKQNPNISFYNLILFLLILSCGFLAITAIHILVAAIGVITTEVDHTILVFRDLSSLARVPIDIYIAPVRTILTFILPIALTFTFPAKALLGVISFSWVFYSLFASLGLFYLSLKFWDWSLKKYSSASS